MNLITINGESKTREEWCKIYNVTTANVSHRMRRKGMTVEEAITYVKPEPRGKYKKKAPKLEHPDDGYPIMSSREALAAGVVMFHAKQRCSACGTTLKWLSGSSSSDINCVCCCPPTDGALSRANIFSHENMHNRKVERLKRKNWQIGVAFGGYNTV